MRAFAVSYELRRLEDVSAWGTPGEKLELHWFGLTHGTYDVVVDGHSLYSPRGESGNMDYAVARIWEDVIAVLPFALEPLPEKLAARVADIDAWRGWVDRAMDHDHDDLYMTALSWWFDREIDAGHFRDAPHVQIWRTGDQLHLSWRVRTAEGSLRWAFPRGDVTIPAAAFRDGVVALDTRLMADMLERIDHVGRGWARPEVHIDLADLRREHAERCSLLPTTVQAGPVSQYSWNDALYAIAELDRRMERPLQLAEEDRR